MRVVIRTDASIMRGSGHVMRCLCLADHLSALGHDITFASIALPDYLQDLLATSGHDVVILPDQGQSNNVVEQAWSTAAQLSDANACAIDCELLVVDHYGLGLAWERAARRNGGRLLVIDDLGREHDCDLLLDQNFYQKPEMQYAGKLPSTCRQLIGPRFALMRPEFVAARRVPYDGDVQRIMVFVGGMDANDMTSHILRALGGGLPGKPAIDVVIGRHHPRRAAIEALCAAADGWSCYVQTDQMAQLMAAADLVIGSGGTNTWERMTVGVPTVALSIAENQRALLDECASAGLLCVPDDDALTDAAALRLQITALLGNRRLRNHFAHAGMMLVDGLGATRVARAAAMLLPVSIRLATMADSDMLLGWRNHVSIRSVSHDKEVIAPQAHRDWYDRVLADSTRSLLVGEYNGIPIGCVRFDEKGPDSVEVSIYLASEVIGSGIGSSLLAASEVWLKDNRSHFTKIDAEVLVGNTASSHLFERAGYRPKRVFYSKDL